MIGAAVVVGLLALYLSVLGRGLLAAIIAAGLVTLLLLVTFDLDRPTRGVIKVPATSVGIPSRVDAPTARRRTAVTDPGAAAT